MLCFLVGLLAIVGGLAGLIAISLMLGCITTKILDHIWWKGFGDNLRTGFLTVLAMFIATVFCLCIYIIGCGILH
jgi:hypothetical protein